VLHALQGAEDGAGATLARAEFVGPQVGQELVEQGGLAALGALLGILIYVMFRFEWRLAVGTIAATVHDVIFTVGWFSLFQIEFDLTVLAAVLAVIGYSVNDTVVVLDRIRENFRKRRKGSCCGDHESVDQRNPVAHHHDQLRHPAVGHRDVLLRRHGDARLLDRHDRRHRGRHLLVNLHRQRQLPCIWASAARICCRTLRKPPIIGPEIRLDVASRHDAL
jgi:hypothetical protein